MCLELFCLPLSSHLSPHSPSLSVVAFLHLSPIVYDTWLPLFFRSQRHFCGARRRLFPPSFTEFSFRCCCLSVGRICINRLIITSPPPPSPRCCWCFYHLCPLTVLEMPNELLALFLPISLLIIEIRLALGRELWAQHSIIYVKYRHKWVRLYSTYIWIFKEDIWHFKYLSYISWVFHSFFTPWGECKQNFKFIELAIIFTNKLFLTKHLNLFVW